MVVSDVIERGMTDVEEDIHNAICQQDERCRNHTEFYVRKRLSLIFLLQKGWQRCFYRNQVTAMEHGVCSVAIELCIPLSRDTSP